MAARTGWPLLRPARRCVLFALSGSPAGVSAGALDHRALDRFLSHAMALRRDAVRRRHDRLGRLLSLFRATDHAGAAAALERVANIVPGLTPRATAPRATTSRRASRSAAGARA